MKKSPIEQLGSSVLAYIYAQGESTRLFVSLLWSSFYLVKKPHLLIKQIFNLGILSLPIIMLSGLFVGMVLCFQAYVNLTKFGAEASVGTVVALALFRELGPVLTGLLYTGRASSSLTAEIGLMRATEQWASYEMMAIDPNKYILLPRLVAGMIVMPILSVIFSAIGIIGGYGIAVISLKVDGGAYWSQMQSAVSFYDDIVCGVLIKSFIFGIISNLIALREGLKGRATADGIARSTTTTVVKGSLLILMADFLLTALLFY